MTERDFENYFTLFQHMTSVISPPDVMVFLKRSVPKLMERIALRGRDFESKISVDYISQLNDLYANWYASYNRGKFLLVDTDDIDLLNSENDYNELVSQVRSVINSPRTYPYKEYWVPPKSRYESRRTYVKNLFTIILCHFWQLAEVVINPDQFLALVNSQMILMMSFRRQ